MNWIRGSSWFNITYELLLEWAIWEKLSIKIMPSSIIKKVYHNSFFSSEMLRLNDVISAMCFPIVNGTVGRLNKCHPLPPLVVGHRWYNLVGREHTDWVWNPAYYWELSTNRQWIKLSMLLFLYLLEVMHCYRSQTAL